MLIFEWSILVVEAHRIWAKSQIGLVYPFHWKVVIAGECQFLTSRYNLAVQLLCWCPSGDALLNACNQVLFFNCTLFYVIVLPLAFCVIGAYANFLKAIVPKAVKICLECAVNFALIKDQKILKSYFCKLVDFSKAIFITLPKIIYSWSNKLLVCWQKSA